MTRRFLRYRPGPDPPAQNSEGSSESGNPASSGIPESPPGQEFPLPGSCPPFPQREVPVFPSPADIPGTGTAAPPPSPYTTGGTGLSSVPGPRSVRSGIRLPVPVRDPARRPGRGPSESLRTLSASAHGTGRVRQEHAKAEGGRRFHSGRMLRNDAGVYPGIKENFKFITNAKKTRQLPGFPVLRYFLRYKIRC